MQTTMSKFSINLKNGVILAISVCLSLVSCRHPGYCYILPNYIEIDRESETNENIGCYSIHVNDWPSSFVEFKLDISFESDSCFVVNEHNICATIGKDTLRFDHWGLLLNKDSTNNWYSDLTPSAYNSLDKKYKASIPFPLVQQLEVPKGKNTLYCYFSGSQFSSPLKVSALLSGVQTTPVVLELKPENAIMYNAYNVLGRLVKWDETKIKGDNDTVSVYLSRQPLKKDSCEILCLLYFDVLGKKIFRYEYIVEYMKNKKDTSMSQIELHLDDIDLCLSDTSYCVEVMDDILMSLYNRFASEKLFITQGCIPFKIRRKDGRPIDYIPDLILPPNNCLLKDGKPLLVDTIIFKGIKSPSIW